MKNKILNFRNDERHYLCKFPNKAVIDSQWISSSDLLHAENSLKQKIKRFDSNYDNQINLKILNSNIPFNSDWIDNNPELSNLAKEDFPLEMSTKSGTNSPVISQKFFEYLERTFLNSDLHYINFDRNTLKVDRVVSCSEMFDIIHPKKAGKIMSKWSDSIVKIVQILINFRYENVSYF